LLDEPEHGVDFALHPYDLALGQGDPGQMGDTADSLCINGHGRYLSNADKPAAAGRDPDRAIAAPPDCRNRRPALATISRQAARDGKWPAGAVVAWGVTA
jgi:hypothetical protein